MKGRTRISISLGATLAVFIVYAACFLSMDLPCGLRSVWPAFVFVFALTMYLTGNPFREDNDAEKPHG